MAITTQAGAFAGLQAPVIISKAIGQATIAGLPQSYYAVGGNPAAGTYANTTTTGGTYSSSSSVPAGFLYHTDPASGNAYLARFVMTASQSCTILLCDRLWDCRPAVAVTTAQTITSPSLPARDRNGGTAGAGIHMGIEVVAATSSTAATISMSYTNSAGTAGQTSSFIDLPLASANKIGDFYRIGLQAGDDGVQSVQSVTFASDWTTGTIQLVAYRIITKLDVQVPNTANAIDIISGGFPRIYNGSCLFLMVIPSTTTASYLSGHYIETQG